MFDIREYDVNEAAEEILIDEREPEKRYGINRPFVPGYSVRNGKAILFDHEPGAIHFLAKKIKEQNIIELAFRMQNLLGLPLEIDYMQMAAAWLRDISDDRIDDEAGATEKFPRLTEFARNNAKAFQKFQLAMNTNKIASQCIPNLAL